MKTKGLSSCSVGSAEGYSMMDFVADSGIVSVCASVIVETGCSSVVFPEQPVRSRATVKAAATLVAGLNMVLPHLLRSSGFIQFLLIKNCFIQ